MRYIVIVECENGLYRARIPSLPGLSAEGTTLEEALKGARQEAASYLSRVTVATIEVDLPTLHLDSAQSWLDAAGTFEGDQEQSQHFADLAAKRQQQRTAAA
jgi:hypothetical protein